VPHFPIYNLRHAFCTNVSWVAPDALIQRAMRHTGPETKEIARTACEAYKLNLSDIDQTLEPFDCSLHRTEPALHRWCL